MAPSARESDVPPRRVTEWVASPWFYLLLSAALGLLVAQVVTGQLAPRWIKALMGLAFVFALFKLPLYGVVALFLVAFPFPTFIFLGNTNIIFVLFVLFAWALKVRLHQEPSPPKTFLDWAAWGYIGVHLISFLNVDNPSDLHNGVLQTEFLAAAVGFYFLVSKLLRTERQLKIAFHAFAVTSLLVSITGVMEYFYPTLVLIPRWFIAVGPTGRRLAEGGRVGGVFGHHALLADFCAISFTLLAYLFIRARRLVPRAFFAILMAAAVFQIFVTANRGGFIIWVIAVIYLLWIGRGALTARRVVIALPILLAAGVIGEVFTKRYGRLITLFWRLASTQFERGIPETRVQVWSSVTKEIPEHIWIGHGPFYDLRGGVGALGRQWPHNAYLMYLWTVGTLGLVVFVWIILKTLVKSYPGGKLKLGKVTFAHGAMAVAHVQVLQFALGQLRDDHQHGNIYPFFMWALIGFAAASRRIVDEQRASGPSRIESGGEPAATESTGLAQRATGGP
jgi:hypothetical protein